MSISLYLKGNYIMILYRAMNDQEFVKTIELNSLAFCDGKNNKFLSPNLDFIYDRVKDGKFCKSHIKEKSNNYNNVIKFDISIDPKYIKILNKNECIINVRNKQHIKINSITKY